MGLVFDKLSGVQPLINLQGINPWKFLVYRG